MAKVFRFHNGDNTLEDWKATQPYGRSEIDGITDPTGANARKQITSIPSPFARIDLVQTAFSNLSQKENPLDGDTIYHKIVSDALDLGQILFNIDQLDGQLNILTWDKTNHLKALLNSNNRKHQLLGETMKLYLEQDARAYNFDKLKCLYLVEYNHQVIGGTSPATLFFTTANEIKGVDIAFGNDTVFDNNYLPLYKRDPDFQKYIHHLVKAYPAIGMDMKCIQNYLSRNLKMLETVSPSLFREINLLKPENYSVTYDTLTTANAGEEIEIFGYPLRKRHKATSANAARESDFVISTDKYNSADKPLVLQNNLNRVFRYTTDNWNKDVEVPFEEPEEILAKRKLPGQVIQYPYLTVSDLLEPYLIRTIYTTNKAYFDGNLRIEAGDPNKGYLLPLKPLFFEFFDTSDLIRGKMYDGKPMIEMVQRVMGSVTVTLRIPVKKNTDYIIFERIYYPPVSENEMAQAVPKLNKGAVTEGLFNIVLFPFFLHPPGIKPDYRAMIIDRDTDGYRQRNLYQLAFYQNTSKSRIEANRRGRSNKQEGDVLSSAFYIVRDNFDYIQVQNGLANGMLIPLLKDAQKGTSAFTFAIDFGTTNTHVEWKKDGDSKSTYPLEINKEDIQYATLIDPESTYLLIPELQSWVEHELFPVTISKNDPYHFPTRTILSFSKVLRFTEGNNTYCLSDFNIPFIYERQPLHSNTAIRSNLKWSEEPGNAILIRRFFENIIFLIRNKILQNGGDPALAEIITFFPSSMDEGRRNAFNDIIAKPGEGVLADFFPEKVRYTSLSESLAPYYYAFNTQAISSSDRPVATIDVGGGTTDIMVFHNEQPAFLTSFRFAAHAVFGDGFNGSSSVNGFVRKYFAGPDGKGGYRSMCEGVFSLPAIFNEMEEHSSADIISFLFSLADNPTLRSKDKKISLFDDLSNDKDLKIVLAVFCGAILYHMAKCMDARKLPPPKTIILSGNGAKIFSIVEGSSGFNGIEDYAKAIFKSVYSDQSHDFTIRVMRDSQPKQLTCKGGLFFRREELVEAYNKGRSGKVENLGRIMDALKFTHFGGNPEVTEGSDSKKLKLTPTYKEIEGDPDYMKMVLLESESCINMLFDILDDHETRIAGIFRLNQAKLERVQTKLKEALKEDLRLGLTVKLKELHGKDNAPIDETLFFYPLTGAVNKTAYYIVSENTLS
ncbi:MAG: hypothetical protein NTW29_17020 [Bacteroidetes bacterium]|nr:hypothetical protein [Bacteroidota bacterium]